MKILILLTLCFSMLLAKASTELNFREIPVEQQLLKFIAPQPFGESSIEININTKSSGREFTSIIVNTLGSQLNISDKHYKHLNMPKLRDNNVIYRINKMNSYNALEEFEFYISYGTPKKIECGYKTFEYLLKSIKITVKSDKSIQIIDDGSYFETCNEYTKIQYEAIGGKP